MIIDSKKIHQVLPERLFWIQTGGIKYGTGSSERGYLLTSDQLRDTVNSVRDASIRGDLATFDLDSFLAEDNHKEAVVMTMQTGRDLKSFLSITEVQNFGHLKDLLTWKGYDWTKSLSARDVELKYPDFVEAQYRVSRYTFVPYARTVRYSLGVTIVENKTIASYSAMLGLSSEDMTFEPTGVSDAAWQIANHLVAHKELRESDYAEILQKCGLLTKELAIDVKLYLPVANTESIESAKKRLASLLENADIDFLQASFDNGSGEIRDLECKEEQDEYDF